VAVVFVRTESGKVDPGRGPYLELALSNGRGELTSVAKVYVSDSKGGRRTQRITAAVYGPARSTRVRLACGVEGAEGAFWFSEPFVGEADFPLPADAKYRTTGYVPPLHELNKRFFAQAITDMSRRHGELETAAVTGRVLDFRGRPLARSTVATDSPLFCTLTDDQGRYHLTVPAGKPMRVRAFAEGEKPAIAELVLLLDRGKSRQMDLQTTPPDAPTELVNGDFNTYHPQEPGLMTGWTGFGTTDGIYESGHKKIVVYDKAFSYEGKGLYFAQSGSNTKMPARDRPHRRPRPGQPRCLLDRKDRKRREVDESRR